MPKPKHDLKFNQLLERIPVGEYKALLTFVKAFGKHAVIDLFKEFMKTGPPFTSTSLSDTKLREKLHVASTKDLKSHGYHLMQLYLVWREVASIPREMKGRATQESVQHMLSLLRTFEHLNLPSKHHKDLRKHIVMMLDSAPGADPMWHLSSYRLALIDADAARPSVKREGDETIRKAISELDRFYLAERLRLRAELLNRQSIVNSSSEDDFANELLGMLKSGKLNDSHAVKLYGALYNTMVNPQSDGAWREYMGVLLECLPRLERAEAGGLMKLAINACIVKAVAGHTAFNGEAATLYKHMDENDLLTRNDEIGPWDYRNMIEIILRSDDRGLAESLTEKYRTKLPKDYSFMWDCAMMQLAIYDEDYNEALRYLNVFEPLAKRLDAHLMLWVKSAELFIHIGLDSAERQNPLNALIKLVQRSKVLSPDRKAAWQNFIRLVRPLTGLPMSRQDSGTILALLEKEIIETKALAQRDWLLRYIRKKKGPAT